MREIVKPKNAVNVVAGLGGILFDRIAGPLPVEEIVAEKDDLTQIEGIGPTFAQRLNAAGVFTFADLAALPPERVQEITQVKAWQANPAEWIIAAKRRA